MSLYYITDTNWIGFIQSLIKHYSVHGLLPNGEHLYWHKFKSEDIAPMVVNRYRALQPLKSYFFPVKEEVTQEPSLRASVIIGAKACDLNHLRTTDKIFAEGVVPDPYYTFRRKNTLIISADCDSYRPGCFCTKMQGKPYPELGFDINVSPARSGFLVETGSAAGENLIVQRRHFFQNPQAVLLQERSAHRARITDSVRQNNASFTWSEPKDLVKSRFLSKKWEDDIASTCVECDACRFTCGTCYCFLLSETSRQWEKLRTWDSCQSAGYGRVAGGANPRKTRGQRLRNYYTCKLLYRHENYGFYACAGCGRCIEVCQGKIDIRKSLQKLADEHHAQKSL